MNIKTRQDGLGPSPTRPSPTAGDSNVDMILSVSGLMMGLSFTIVGLRIWVRHFMIKTLGIDDTVMIAALVRRSLLGFPFWSSQIFCPLFLWEYYPHGEITNEYLITMNR